ncbi:MAG: glycosyltransferase family 2 protein [Vibrio sp.]
MQNETHPTDAHQIDNPPLVSVIIKTLNEEAGIAATILSIRAHMASIAHEIVVADSLSTDNTQQIARDLGVMVVSLSDADDRCCGVGHQLGYLHSKGEYLLLLDGDMKLEAGFVPEAIAYLEAHTDYAGVAGRVEMDEAHNYEFESRKQRINQIYPLGDVSHLSGGGLYRRSAIDDIGYLTNQNLHAFEEAELGIRLTQAGYKLHRLDIPYFFHSSYTLSTFELLKRRWQSKYLCGPGELLRSAWGTPYFSQSLRTVKTLAAFSLYLVGVVAALLLAIGFGCWSLFGLSLLPVCAFFGLKAWQNRSLKAAGLSVINLSVFSAGLIRGLCLKQKPATKTPKHQIIAQSQDVSEQPFDSK